LRTWERKLQLADESLRILARDGTASLTARNLGQALGISDAAIFKHYEKMESIVDAAVLRFESLLPIPAMSSDDPLGSLQKLFVDRVTRMQANPEVLQLVFTNSLESAAGAAGADRVRRVMKRTMAFIRRCVRRAQEEGSISRTLDPSIVMSMIQGVLHSAANGTLRAESGEELWSRVMPVFVRSDSPEVY